MELLKMPISFYEMRFFCAILPLAILISCKNKVSNYLIGNWKLDSLSGPNGKFFPAYKIERFTLRKDKTFFFEWYEGDVGGEFKGTYKVVDSTSTSKSLYFLSERNELVRSYTILENNMNRLKLSTKESYVATDSVISFVRIDIFKRVK